MIERHERKTSEKDLNAMWLSNPTNIWPVTSFFCMPSLRLPLTNLSSDLQSFKYLPS